MDIKNENDSKKENKHPGQQKGKGGKIKRVEGKKPGPSVLAAEKLPDTRGRAKSTLVNPFDNKKPLNTTKDSKPVATITSDRFNLLKSMFEKKADPVVTPQEPKKFEPKKFSVFQQFQNNQPQEEKKVEHIQNKPSGISDAIKKRMEDLMNSNKRTSVQPKIDPILEQRKFMRYSEENDDYEDEDQEDFGISDESISDKDEGLSESEEEKEKSDENKDKNQIIQEKEEKEDSFEDDKKEVKVDEEMTNDNNIEHKIEDKSEREEKIEETLENSNKLEIDNEANNKSHDKDDE
jgi:hypothetical protein